MMNGRSVVVVLLGMLGVVTVVHAALSVDEARRLHQELSERRNGIRSLHHLADSLHNDLIEESKRTCSVGGGMSHHCLTQLLSSKLQGSDWLKSGNSPGKKKRSAEIDSAVEYDRDLDRNIEDFLLRRQRLTALRRILDEIDADLINQQKRNCQFNLGGHCQTQSAAQLADQWHYLNSAVSPGRKRRSIDASKGQNKDFDQNETAD